MDAFDMTIQGIVFTLIVGVIDFIRGSPTHAFPLTLGMVVSGLIFLLYEKLTNQKARKTNRS